MCCPVPAPGQVIIGCRVAKGPAAGQGGLCCNWFPDAGDPALRNRQYCNRESTVDGPSLCLLACESPRVTCYGGNDCCASGEVCNAEDRCDYVPGDAGEPGEPTGCATGNCSCDPRSSAPTGIGDPFNVGTGNTVFSTVDFELQGHLGPLPFTRFYNSSAASWAQGGGVAGLPTPFGLAPGSTDSILWSHEYYSFLHEDGLTLHWRSPTGYLVSFERCIAPGCWATPEPAGRTLDLRLQRTALGWRIYDQRRVLEYETLAADGTHYLLSRIKDDRGNVAVTLEYGPSLDCGPAFGSLYLLRVAAGAGTTGSAEFQFIYGRVGSPAQCVLSWVWARDRALASWSMGVIFTYAADTPGLLEQAAAPPHVEAYSYSSNALVVTRDGVERTTHTYGSNAEVVSDATPSSALSVTWTSDAGAPLVCGHRLKERVLVDAKSQLGDGGDGPSSFSRRLSAVYTAQMGGYRTYSIEDTCPNDDSCSSGTQAWEWTCSAPAPDSGTLLDYERAHQNKRGNWTVWNKEEQTHTPTGRTLPLLTRTQRGATDNTGTDALEETRTEYELADDGTPMLRKVVRDSVLTAGATAQTLYINELSTHFVRATIKTGDTFKFASDAGTWSIETKNIATFYFPYFKAAGESSPPSGEPLRIRELHGPCFVDSTAATDCAAGEVVPIQQYHYWPTAGGGSENKTGRLRYVKRFKSSTVSSLEASPLVTEFADYDARGNPTLILDENAVPTFLGYSAAGLLTSRQVGAGGPTTTFTYANGRLTAVGYPQGNFEVYSFLHRTTGVLTDKLQQKFKASDAFGNAGWSEKAEFTYWPDGTLKKEAYYTRSLEVRRSRSFAADAHRRLTQVHTGAPTSGYTEMRAYDRANNLAGVGPALNSAPAWCGGIDVGTVDLPVSKLCAHLVYDRADRLAWSDLYPSTSATPSRQCFFYDAHSNVTKVVSGCETTDACEALPSSCEETAAVYKHDDFGNIVEITLPNTGWGSNSPIPIRQSFTALGAPAFKQVPENGSTRVYERTYDGLGRERRLTLRYDEGPYTQTLWEKYYDGSVLPPTGTGCPQVANVLGRLTLIEGTGDSLFYSYDSQGRIVKELRPFDVWSGPCRASHDYLAPDTEYTYTSNGNISTITYPLGRRVAYTYKNGYGDQDRVDKVSISTWDGLTSNSHDIITNIDWEPYGGLRAYQMNSPASSAVSSAEYLLSGDSATEPSLHCGLGRPSGLDETGRLRALWVSRAPLSSSPSYRVGDIYRRTFTWTADQLTTQDTCLLTTSGGVQPQREKFTYDNMLRLTGAARPSGNFAATGGPYSSLSFAHDGRGNRHVTGGESVNGCDSSLTYGPSSRPDQVVERTTSCDSLLDYVYSYKDDGTVFRKKWGGIADGGATLDFQNGGGFEPSGGTETVFKAVGWSDNVYYQMYYDAYSRRAFKNSPLAGRVSRMLYNALDNSLLSDLWRDDVSHFHAGDDYVWLDGKAVAVVRYKWEFDLNGNTVLATELEGDCPSNGQSRSCGVYFLVNDHLPKPVLMLNSDMRVVGVGEYEPFGNVNRNSLIAGTAHPYTHNESGAVVADIAPPVAANTEVSVRARFHFVETVTADGLCEDCAKLTDQSGTPVSSFIIGGTSITPVVTPWVTLPGDGGYVSVRFYSDGQDAGRGITMEAYDYRRSEVYTGPDGGRRVAATAWVPLRMPGQYYDEETDLVDSWNRYYEPTGGTFLQIEPILQDPRWVGTYAAAGKSLPHYAYGLNNPVSFTDPDGRAVPIVVGGIALWKLAVAGGLIGAGMTLDYCIRSGDCTPSGTWGSSSPSMPVTQESTADVCEGPKMLCRLISGRPSGGNCWYRCPNGRTVGVPDDGSGCWRLTTEVGPNE